MCRIFMSLAQILLPGCDEKKIWRLDVSLLIACWRLEVRSRNLDGRIDGLERDKSSREASEGGRWPPESGTAWNRSCLNLATEDGSTSRVRIYIRRNTD